MNPYNIVKKLDQIEDETIGRGNDMPENQGPKSESLPLSKQAEESSTIEDLNKSVLNKLDTKLQSSFLHPHFVDTDKIEFPLKRKHDSHDLKTSKGPSQPSAKKIKNEVATTPKHNFKHKFQFF